MSELLKSLGLVPSGGNYETVRRRLAALGLDTSFFRSIRRGRTIRACLDQEVIDAVRASRSLAQVLARLGIKPGGNQGRVKTRIRDLRLNTSHFIGQGWRAGSREPVVPPRPLETVLVVARPTQTSDLRRRLIREGLKEPRCEICGQDTWYGHPIPLELDHVNGNRDDNRLTNLRMLCPNCHAQTPTFRGRNIGASQRLS